MALLESEPVSVEMNDEISMGLAVTFGPGRDERRLKTRLGVLMST